MAHHPYWSPPLGRKLRSAGAPLGVLIALASVIGLIVILLTALNPVGTAVGFVLSSIAMAAVVLAYIWLDRWEPEPPRLLVFAFLWGASVAIILTFILGLVFEAVVAPGSTDTSPASVVLGAPLIEEAAKGLFLLLMMTGRRRNELNSLTDCLVYAGLVGAGFAWLEDILYISSAESLGDSLVTAVLRLVMAPFGHSLFTTMFAIGVYFALQRRDTATKVGFLLVGYLGAVLMHALWNGSSLLGGGAYLLVYVLWMVPIFGMTIALAVTSRRREQRLVASKLPGMAAAGVITPNEITWLGSIHGRKQAVTEATRIGGRQAGKAVHAFAAQIVELAFLRDRIDRGFGDPRVYAMLHEETYAVYATRASTPVLHHLAGYRAWVKP
ncbi:PrsW family intramembrane metalloprotease [Mycolicibacterium sp. F2034L]|nr:MULTISPECIES: PrsW family intramembrane metalloprotease [Mycobacteriaceae]MCK0173298.1 PrsW family intramembrane metalloprotease [Mycolicibacterium sp. F2034L]